MQFIKYGCKIICRKIAIKFSDWVDKLQPSKRVSLWSKNGENKGVFTMDKEQLFNKFKKATNEEI